MQISHSIILANETSRSADSPSHLARRNAADEYAGPVVGTAVYGAHSRLK